MSDQINRNVAEARTHHTDRESIGAMVRDAVPFEPIVMALLNELMPGIGLYKETDEFAPWDLTNSSGLRVEIERGDWAYVSLSRFPDRYTLNFLSRKHYDRMHVFVKMEKNMQSGFIMICSHLTKMIELGCVRAEHNPQSKIRGTGEDVYKLSAKQRATCVAAGQLLMIENGDYSGIKPFFIRHGFYI